MSLGDFRAASRGDFRYHRATRVLAVVRQERGTRFLRRVRGDTETNAEEAPTLETSGCKVPTGTKAISLFCACGKMAPKHSCAQCSAIKGKRWLHLLPFDAASTRIKPSRPEASARMQLQFKCALADASGSQDDSMDYLITFRCYGTWLHGDARGSVDARHNTPGEPLLEPIVAWERAAKRKMQGEMVTLNAACRACVEAAIHEVAVHRKWRLHALAVQTNHVHLVVSTETTPEKAMSDFKAYSTRHLREKGLMPESTPIWSSHGSTKYLKSRVSLAAACRYVFESQADLTDCP